MSLKELISKQNCTQSKLAKDLKTLNCYKYQQQVSDWMTGKRLPDAYSIWCMSKILNVSTDTVIEASLKSAGRI